MIKFILSLITGLLISASILAVPTHAADAAKLALNVDSPASLQGLAVGSKLVLSVSGSNIPADASTAEIVLTFDPKVLQGVSIDEQSAVLAANKSIDNSTGKVTVDIAKIGDGAYVADTSLVKFTFTLSAAADQTVVAIDPTSTLGIPNALAANDYSQITLTLSQPGTPVATGSAVPVGVQLALAVVAVLILGVLLLISMLIVKRLRHRRLINSKP